MMQVNTLYKASKWPPCRLYCCFSTTTTIILIFLIHASHFLVESHIARSSIVTLALFLLLLVVSELFGRLAGALHFLQYVVLGHLEHLVHLPRFVQPFILDVLDVLLVVEPLSVATVFDGRLAEDLLLLADPFEGDDPTPVHIRLIVDEVRRRVCHLLVDRDHLDAMEWRRQCPMNVGQTLSDDAQRVPVAHAVVQYHLAE
mmetsp:Transcript_12321/g.18582  ORF Transcript_12321/g.18582 Transcript_12321/m.18582 type:complete len:201 (+) Transcript_12321:1579-2181(+)